MLGELFRLRVVWKFTLRRKWANDGPSASGPVVHVWFGCVWIFASVGFAKKDEKLLHDFPVGLCNSLFGLLVSH